MVQFYPWIILVSFLSCSLSYIFIPKNTGKNLNWSIKQKNKNTVHVWPKEKKWSLTHSKLHWVTVCPKKVWTLCWILPFAPPATGTYPSPLRHAIQHCYKRRPLSTLLKSYRVKTLLLGNRKTILLKWINAVSFKFWFHHLHVLFLVTKQVLRWNFHVTEQKISFPFPGRPFSPNNSLPSRNFSQVSYNILFVCFGHEDPLSLQLFKQCKYPLCKTVLQYRF